MIVLNFFKPISQALKASFDFRSRTRRKNFWIPIIVFALIGFFIYIFNYEQATSCYLNSSTHTWNGNKWQKSCSPLTTFFTRKKVKTLGVINPEKYAKSIAKVRDKDKYSFENYGNEVYEFQITALRGTLFFCSVFLITIPALIVRRLKDAGGTWWMSLILFIPILRYFLLFLLILPTNRLPKFNLKDPIKSFGLDAILLFFKRIPAIYKNAELRIKGKTRKCKNCGAPLKDIYNLKCEYCDYENQI